jgi:DNA modification methylase
MCVTSPPYWNLRDYGVAGQLGLEDRPQTYVNKITGIFESVRDVLRDDATCWLNIADTYYGGGRGCTNKNTAKVPPSKKVSSLKTKDLCLVPQRLAIALQENGWYIRNDIIWHKSNCMPESVRDRCVKSHEYLYLMSKSKKYYFDYEAIQEEATGYDGRQDTRHKGSPKYASNMMPGKKEHCFAKSEHQRWQFKKVDDKLLAVRNRRSVWSVGTKAFKDAHFATFPEKLIEPCILAGSREGDVVLDPFMGAATTAVVCERLGRKWIVIELNEKYCEIAAKRIKEQMSKYALFNKKDNL